MKKAARKRSKPYNLDTNVSSEELENLSGIVKYIGSSAHKRGKNPLVPNQWKTTPRPNASICPSSITDAKIVTEWLKIAIKKGAISAGAKRVWYIGDEGIFEAIASGNYEYHGYPIEKDELPQGVLGLYE
jgi:hypothetical protein